MKQSASPLPWFALAGAMAWLGTSTAYGTFLANNTTNLNVLREYNGLRTQLVSSTGSVLGGGSFNGVRSANDGSGNKTQTDSFDSGSDVVSETFTLARPATVGSYNIQNANPGRNPSLFELEGLTDSGWVTLDSFSPGGTASFVQRNFSPATVSAVRYTATGPPAGGAPPFAHFQLYELMVFMTPGQTLDLGNRGFNTLRDLLTAGKIVGTNTSTGASGPGWAAAQSGTALTLLDGIYSPGHIKLQSPPALTTDRAFVSYDFDQAYPVHFGVIGTFEAQVISNFQFWTSNLLNPDEANDNDWVLQYTQGGVGVGNPGFPFQLALPGDWQHVRFTWGAQSGAMTELELYSIPEPATAALLSLGALLLWRRRPE